MAPNPAKPQMKIAQRVGYREFLVARGGIEPGPQETRILPLDYFQLRFNFLCEAAQSLK